MKCEVVVYSRRACHLCEDLLEAIQPLLRGKAELNVVDIDKDPVLAGRFGADVPVVEINGEVICKHFLDPVAVQKTLS